MLTYSSFQAVVLYVNRPIPFLVPSLASLVKTGTECYDRTGKAAEGHWQENHDTSETSRSKEWKLKKSAQGMPA